MYGRNVKVFLTLWLRSRGQLWPHILGCDETVMQLVCLFIGCICITLTDIRIFTKPRSNIFLIFHFFPLTWCVPVAQVAATMLLIFLVRINCLSWTSCYHYFYSVMQMLYMILTDSEEDEELALEGQDNGRYFLLMWNTLLDVHVTCG